MSCDRVDRLSPKQANTDDEEKSRRHKDRSKDKESRHRHSHKERKEKKRKHRSRSRERKHKRKRSHQKKRSHKRRSRSRSSRSSVAPSNNLDAEKEISPPIEESLSKNQDVSIEDDLPVGADFQTFLKEQPADIASCSKDVEPFPLSKERRKDDDDEETATNKVSVSKVFECKKVNDFIPRKLKLNINKNTPTVPPVEPKAVENVIPPVAEEKEFGPCPPTEEEWVADELERAVDEAIKPIPVEEKAVSDAEWSSGSEKERDKSIRSDARSDHEHRGKKQRDRSPRRSRSRDREKHRSRRSSRDRHREKNRSDRLSQSHSRRHTSRRSRSPARRDRRDRRNRYSRSRSRSSDDDRIDKEKLLAIAKKQAGRLKEDGIVPRSIDDFVSYCERIQKKQSREDRLARGEIVSSGESEPEDNLAFKHPYTVKPAEPIKFNIFSAPPPPSSTPQTCILDSAQLRIQFPVSSGAVHKSNTDSEWTPVLKEPAPVTCSTVQKKYKAPTSLDNMKNNMLENSISVGINIAPAVALPPPPAPPSFGDLLPPPPVPPLLVIPPKHHYIIKEAEAFAERAPNDVSKVITNRARAQRRLAIDPNDFDAHRALRECEERMNAWASLKSAPGEFTGTTGLQVLSADELQPSNPRFHAWIKKDMFKTAKPAMGGVGMRLMEKMGWMPGKGLGREETGSVEPLMLDVKSDRKGLTTVEDRAAKASAGPKNVKIAAATELAGKHPVSMLMELCARYRWDSPVFNCQEMGPANSKEFLYSVTVGGVEYQSSCIAKSKKEGKALACQVVLQAMGLVPQ